MDRDNGSSEFSDESEITSTPAEHMSERSLKLGLLSNALQYYSTIIPAFIAAVALLLLMWPSLRISTVFVFYAMEGKEGVFKHEPRTMFLIGFLATVL